MMFKNEIEFGIYRSTIPSLFMVLALIFFLFSKFNLFSIFTIIIAILVSIVFQILKYVLGKIVLEWVEKNVLELKVKDEWILKGLIGFLILSIIYIEFFLIALVPHVKLITTKFDLLFFAVSIATIVNEIIYVYFIILPFSLFYPLLFYLIVKPEIFILAGIVNEIISIKITKKILSKVKQLQ